MAHCGIRNYANPCCQSTQVKIDPVTGVIGASYQRYINGDVIRNDGIILTSGARDSFLLPPNGSIAASRINDAGESPLCCNNDF